MHGRDNRFRPILIVNSPKLLQYQSNIELILAGMTVLFEFILENYLLVGQVENW